MTHRSSLVVGLAALLLASAVHAQDKAEVFGGFQYTHPDGGPNLNGWNGALTGNLTKNFGITGDFSGTYGSGASFYTYTFGPKFTANFPVVKPYFHVLFGGAHASTGIGSGDGFTTMLGGGFDAGGGASCVAHRAIRLVPDTWIRRD